MSYFAIKMFNDLRVFVRQSSHSPPVPYSILFYEDSSKHLVYKLDNIVYLHIKLTDQDNNLLDMNDIHYTLTIEITIVKK